MLDRQSAVVSIPLRKHSYQGRKPRFWSGMVVSRDEKSRRKVEKSRFDCDRTLNAAYVTPTKSAPQRHSVLPLDFSSSLSSLITGFSAFNEESALLFPTPSLLCFTPPTPCSAAF